MEKGEIQCLPTKFAKKKLPFMVIEIVMSLCDLIDPIKCLYTYYMQNI